MVKNLKKKIVLGVLATTMLGNLMVPTTLTVVAAETNENLEIKETNAFQIVNETMLFDKRDGYFYEFETNEAMKFHMESDGPLVQDGKSNITMASTYYEWRTINFEWWTKTEVRELAADAERASLTGLWASVAGTWLWKFPYVGATIATVSALIHTQNRVFVNAAANNKSITHYRERRVQPGPHGVVYRSRFVTHN